MRLAYIIVSVLSASWMLATYEFLTHNSCVAFVDYAEPPTHGFAWCQPLGVVMLLGPPIIFGILVYQAIGWFRRRFRT
jgi:hypothetical protein